MTKKTGKVELEDGIYEGELNSKGEASGNGVLTAPDGTKTRGHWSDNVLVMKVGDSYREDN